MCCPSFQEPYNLLITEREAKALMSDKIRVNKELDKILNEKLENPKQ